VALFKMQFTRLLAPDGSGFLSGTTMAVVAGSKRSAAAHGMARKWPKGSFMNWPASSGLERDVFIFVFSLWDENACVAMLRINSARGLANSSPAGREPVIVDYIPD
jgi:hypothetical protein